MFQATDEMATQADDQEALYQLEEKWRKNYEEKNLIIDQLERELSCTVDELVRTRNQVGTELPERNYFGDANVYPNSFKDSIPMAPPLSSMIHSVHSSPPRNRQGQYQFSSMTGPTPSSLDPLRKSQENSNSGAALILNEENKRLKASIAIFTNQVARLQEDIKFMQTEAKDSQGKLSYRQQQIKEYESEIQRRICDEADLKQQIATLETNLELKRDENLKLQTELCEHNKQSLILLQRLENLESSSNQQQFHDLLIKSYDDVKRIEMLDKQLVQMTSENKALREQSAALLTATKEKKRAATPPRDRAGSIDKARVASPGTASPKRTTGTPSPLRRLGTFTSNQLSAGSAGYVSKPVVSKPPTPNSKSVAVSNSSPAVRKSPSLTRSSTMSALSPSTPLSLRTPLVNTSSRPSPSTPLQTPVGAASVEYVEAPSPLSPPFPLEEETPVPVPMPAVVQVEAVEAPQATYLVVGNTEPVVASAVPRTRSSAMTTAPKSGLSRSSTMTTAPQTGLSRSSTITTAPKSGLSRSSTMTAVPKSGLSRCSTMTAVPKSGLSRSSTMTTAPRAGSMTAQAAASPRDNYGISFAIKSPPAVGSGVSNGVTKGSSFRKENKPPGSISTLAKKVTVVIPTASVEEESAAIFPSVDDSFDDLPLVDEMREKDDSEVEEEEDSCNRSASSEGEIADGVKDASFSSVTVANTIANYDPASSSSPTIRSESPKNPSMIALRRQQTTGQSLSDSIELVVPQMEPIVTSASTEGSVTVDGSKMSELVPPAMTSILKRKAVLKKEAAAVLTKSKTEGAIAADSITGTLALGSSGTKSKRKKASAEIQKKKNVK